LRQPKAVDERAAAVSCRRELPDLAQVQANVSQVVAATEGELWRNSLFWSSKPRGKPHNPRAPVFL